MNDRDEVIGYGLFAGVGVLPIVDVLERHGSFGAEPTIGLAMLVVGVIGLAGAAWRALRGRERWWR